ncbi:MAG TPA: molybdopterin molybdotransferase MoeA, partial [Saprospiraceae bacterium]|nr:molybdopterin molybdotransferase MoeA [Saprospiraceae bacterium]
TEIILDTELEKGTDRVGIENAINRILAENIYADRDFPPFDRVTMDGIAIKFEEFQSGRRFFKKENLAAAGSAQLILQNPENCIEIMTGAILPENADTVIRYEDLDQKNDGFQINLENVKPGQNIHRKGEDKKESAVLIATGKLISPAEIGVCATVGKSKLLVKKLPAIVVISNGDELVEIEERPLSHQIRKSNNWSVRAFLQQNGIHCDLAHLPDNQKIIEQELKALTDKYDVLVLSGGVSMGQFDFIPQTLESAGIELLFHKVSQRPGKPFWFGKKGNEKVVFAFPGNPVSTFMCAIRYFLPWYKKKFQAADFSPEAAVLSDNFEFKPDLTYFLQVKTFPGAESKLNAKPIVGNGSGDLSNLVDADGFLELPKDRDKFRAGEIFPYYPFR